MAVGGIVVRLGDTVDLIPEVEELAVLGNVVGNGAKSALDTDHTHFHIAAAAVQHRSLGNFVAPPQTHV